MAQSRESLIRRFEATAETYKKKGDRNWAYAKNDFGDEHYGIAKDAYTRAARARAKAEHSEMEGQINTSEAVVGGFIGYKLFKKIFS